jgi:predicted NBD/HSP70 family sugar kinase
MDLRKLLRAPTGAKSGNRLRILRTVMIKPGNQTEVYKRSNLSSATVSEAVKELEQSGHLTVEQVGRDKFVRLTPTTGVAVGVELGFQETVVVARLAHQDRNEAVTRSLPIGVAGGESNWLARVVEGIQQIVYSFGADAGGLATLGIGVPRMIRPRTGEFARPLLPPWEDGTDPAQAIAGRLAAVDPPVVPRDMPFPDVLVDNEANLGALAERAYVHPDKEMLLYVKASTGVGGGICAGGVVYRGGSGVAGEIGHVKVDRNGPFCLCGGRGCLETLIGSDALVRHARAVYGGQTARIRDLEHLIEKARRGNALCVRILREAGTLLGQTLGNICNILNPDVIVLGGTLSTAQDLVLGPCWEAIESTALGAAYGNGLRLEASAIEYASAHGALLMGLDGTTYD